MLWRGLILSGILPFHLLLSSLLDLGTNLVLFCANLFFLACGFLYRKSLNNFRWSVYLAGYFLLFLVLFALGNRPLIFILTLFIYSGLFRIPWLLGYFFLFLFSIVVLTGYWISSLIVFSLFYFIILEFIKKRDNRFLSFMFAVGFFILVLILLPLLNLLFQSFPQTLLASFNQPLREALAVSFATAFTSSLIILIFGVPLAFCMARAEFTAKPIIDALIDLPILVPQTAVGIGLLLLLGPKTPVGEFFSRTFGISFPGSHLGIIACQIFVSMPFLVRSAISAFESVNLKLENVSRALGANPFQTFLRVSLPLAFPGIFNGFILSFCRAVSEVGSLMIVAYRPSTIGIHVNDIFVQYGISEAIPITVVFVIICLWSFIVLKWSYEIRKRSILKI